MLQSTGKIYFAIKTENHCADIDFFNKYLKIKPTHFTKMFEKGHIPRCTIWEYGTKEINHTDYDHEVEKLINELEPHKEDFKVLLKSFPEFNAVLQIVIYLGMETPSLHFSAEVVSFLNELGISIDCDLYNQMA